MFTLLALTLLLGPAPPAPMPTAQPKALLRHEATLATASDQRRPFAKGEPPVVVQLLNAHDKTFRVAVRILTTKR